jgi:hypothetical protein
MNLLEMDLQADMEAEMAIPVPEGAPPRSAVAVVAKVLSKEAKHSTFLKNAGLQPSSTVKLNKPTAAAVSAHVHDLEAQLKRSQEEAEQMKQQFAARRRSKRQMKPHKLSVTRTTWSSSSGLRKVIGGLLT